MKTFLRIVGILVAALVVVAVVFLCVVIFWPLDRTTAEEIALAPDSMALPDIPEGEYPHLATTAADCSACHTAKGGKPFAGGRPFPTPFGTIYSSNITPDLDTGIGDYSLDEFRAAVVDGIRADGAHLYPAMPYPDYRHMAERDIEAIYNYLTEEVEPVHAANREPDLTFPFNLRFGLRVWKWFALPEPGFQPPDDPVIARGAYLVEAAGHCGACHTPRNMLMIEKGYTAADPDFLAGGKLGDWSVPTLRGEDGAPARWSADNLGDYLRTGRNIHTGTTGEMRLVVSHSLQHLPESDVKAIVAYLRSIAPNGGGAVPERPAAGGRAESLWAAVEEGGTTAMLASADPEALGPGALLYLDNCAACHLVDGKGGDRVIPELDGSPTVTASSTGGLLNIILHGAELPSTEAAPMSLEMPSFADRLSDEEIAALATFVRSAWSNDAGSVSPEEVAEIRAAPAQ